MNFKDPKIQITIGLAVLTVALLALFWKFSWQPSAQRIAQLRADESRLRTELDQVRAAVAGLQKLEQDYKILEKKWAQAQKLLPTDKEIPVLLKQITNAGIEAQVRFSSFKPGPAANATALSQSIPVTITVIGTYQQIAMFLKNMGDLPRIVISSGLRLVPSSEDPNRHIKADLTATTYVFKSGGAPSAQPTTTRRVQ
ncbi:MAG: type 4a pilus biogenesis protein PilO [Candidatus Edwardsbacteria bacterium]|nr:type 4a pilus biogenesis protein PilO [Candidatus Edwardsbacteria bacterium]